MENESKMRFYIADVFGDVIHENVLYATSAYTERYILLKNNKWINAKKEWLFHIKRYEAGFQKCDNNSFIINEESIKSLNDFIRKESLLVPYTFKVENRARRNLELESKLEAEDNYEKLDEYYKSLLVDKTVRTMTLDDVFKALSAMTPEQLKTPIVHVWDESGDIIPITDIDDVLKFEDGAVIL